ncbi:hypothetical protein BM43_3025 [Burkholderia gladioli]|uniref:Uncharacterized protein n=1 Tax=Burkholderia gladioli TaxID=28095 RepID=A0AAW3EV76_BURGA|nr:hypothetical protein [Burkholderia gladioli]AJX00898.1 hypothetical protein BM43_3025 [Burkholderia gladioli]ASD78999.1 hypothetical protein CEJ98_08245 [Burkholderia gladioli pv. gladioli]KGC09658.1 hypothetical protein DM48_5819 [Burkholderia gladioli]KGC10520.1 hypothetical protein DM48_5871 [Burkholderia gladioli]MBU9272906.1 hypothetical protein [Burkholderia gladioli]
MSLDPISTSPRVDKLITDVMKRFPGESRAAQARYYEEVHQHLAPLARELEAEVARLRVALYSTVPGERSARDDGFFAGVCVALQVLTAHDQGVIWKDIVKACGVDELLQYAANIEPEEWELAGFKHFARGELGRRKPATRGGAKS